MECSVWAVTDRMIGALVSGCASITNTCGSRNCRRKRLIHKDAAARVATHIEILEVPFRIGVHDDGEFAWNST